MVSAMAAPGPSSARVARAWEVLHGVLDPEVPAISVTDLGIVRGVIEHDDGLEVLVTPTYSGCPATEVIEQAIAAAIDDAGLGPARVTQRRAPAWTTDWITPEGREKLRAYGIAPPGACASDSPSGGRTRGPASSPPGGSDGRSEGAVHRIRLMARDVACPRCGSARTERLSAFGSTACKSLYRCLACREPFEHFKPL
ncbi:MAG: phenylacetate-CoA oxygenase subunit PaaJ [Burkholderiales bacterium]|nr:phenylacetate-CoA oxygenase subunit PaaJ [Burkholderiales bacterium]